MIIRGDEPIFIIRRTPAGLDQYGNETFDTEEILIRDGLFAFGGSSDVNEINRDPKSAKLTLYLPPGTVVRDDDIFEIRETHWVQDGSVNEWPTVNGFEAGVVVPVRRHIG